MDLRRYELATLAAARQPALELLLPGPRAGSCSSSSASRCAPSPSTTAAAGLDEVDARSWTSPSGSPPTRPPSTRPGLQRLRDLGLSDADILDVTLAAAARCFFSTTLDALGVRADASYRDLPPDVVEALVVGRPIAEA